MCEFVVSLITNKMLSNFDKRFKTSKNIYKHNMKVGDDMEYSIEIHKLKKSYAGKQALHGIDLKVEKGEIFALLGPNGAGKSTTISIIATLSDADQGYVKVENLTVGIDNAEIRNKIGIVFQNSILDEILSVKDNLLLRCGFYGLNKKEAQTRVFELSDECALNSFLNQKVKTLSGGERRRADIARALIPKPQILILDEPCTGLDPDARKKLWDTILKLHKQQNMTIFLTTHYMEEAELADHICILKQGNILVNDEKGKIKEVFGKQHLYLYPAALEALKKILAKNKISYVVENQVIIVEPLNYFHCMSILRKCEVYIEHFELTASCLEDVYLRLLKEEKNDNFNQT